MTASTNSVPEPASGLAPDGRDVIYATLIFAGLLGLMVLALAILAPPGREPLDSPSAKLALTAILLAWQNLAILVAAGVVCWRHGASPRRLLAFAPLSWRACLLSALAGVGIGISLDLGVQFLQHLLHLPLRTPGAALLAPAGFSWTAYITMFGLGALLAPLAEEILFRGLLYGWLRRRFAVPLAALLSAIPFGLLHLEPPYELYVLYASLAGFLLALLFQRAGSLWASVIAHATINTIAITSVYLALAEGIPIGHI